MNWLSTLLQVDTALILGGSAVAIGLVLVVSGSLVQPPRLKAALAALDDNTGLVVVEADGEQSVVDSGDRLERWASAMSQRLPLSDKTHQRLAQQGRTIGDLFVAKLALATAGLFVPALVGGVAWWLGMINSPWPLAVSLAGAVGGYLLPDWQLREQSVAWQQHSADAISVYFDLVTLIRLGNASAVQSLRDAAELSSAPVFVEMRDALDRARLQQRAPWSELHRLSQKLGLPEVSDLASIMALDDQGAALVDALRARVKELRRAHLASAKLESQKQAEAMTIWMVVPVLIFALIFLIPPIMNMMKGI